MRITSSAFGDGQGIPRQYSGEGAGGSPPMEVHEVPDGTRSLALIVDDPDAPGKTWVHWLIWNIPVDRTRIPEAVPADREAAVLGGARQGTNDFGDIGYTGPRPPRGHGVHRYRFTVHALNEALELEAGADRGSLEAAMEGCVVEQARITGTYERA